jgi:hypothetical protein
MSVSGAVRFHQGDSSLKKNPKGEIVSVAKSKAEKSNPWIKAVMKARKALIKSGDLAKGEFAPVKGKLLAKAHEIYKK